MPFTKKAISSGGNTISGEAIDKINEELDKIKKLEETTVSTITIESNFTTVEATNNGYFEDVKLEGKTIESLINYKQTLNTNVWNNFIKTTNLKYMLKNNTEYTIVAYVQGLSNNKAFSLQSSNNYGLFNSIDININGNGTWVSKVTTKADFTNMTDVLFTVHNPSSNIGTFTLQLYIFEGDHTQVPSNSFKGLKSVGEDADEIVVSSNNNQPKQIETTDDNSITTTIDNPNYQSDKKRLLYYNEETQTWEKLILRQWDSIEKHSDGKYYYHQRSGEVVFNGSENWLYAGGQSNTDTSLFYFNISTRKPSSIGICDKFIQISNYTDKNIEGIFYGTDINIRIDTSKLSTQDATGFKQWLQANNVTVVYQLAQEKVYECTNIDLITYANETNYIVECGVIAPRTTLKVMSNISNVVRELQRKVSVLENDCMQIFKYILAGDQVSAAYMLYPEDFEDITYNDETINTDEVVTDDATNTDTINIDDNSEL